MSAVAPIALREAQAHDVPRIAAIYAHHVLTGLASFEVEPPDEPEIARRRAEVRARGLPFLVAEADGRVLGYAYAARYRTRPAYRHTLEDSVYVDPGDLSRHRSGRDRMPWPQRRGERPWIGHAGSFDEQHELPDPARDGSGVFR